MGFSAQEVNRLTILAGELMQSSINDMVGEPFQRIQTELGQLCDSNRDAFEAALTQHLSVSEQQWVRFIVDSRPEKFLRHQLGVILHVTQPSSSTASTKDPRLR